MSERIIVTHIYLAKPNPNGAVPLVGVCRAEESGMFFVQGSEEDLIPKSVVDTALEEGHIAKLLQENSIESDEQFFLYPSGKIYRAKSILGPRDPDCQCVSILRPMNERPLLRLADTGILQHVGLTSADLLIDDLPHEFEESLRHLEDYIEDDQNKKESIGKQCNLSIFLCSNFSYPDEIDNGLRKLHELISLELSQVGDKTLQNHPHTSIDMQIRKRIEFLPTVFLFPFFWIKSLRPYWGLIRYGYQKRMGVVLSKKGEYWNTLNRPVWGRLVDRQRVLEDVFDLACRRGAKIHVFQGYIFDELSEMIFQEYAESINSLEVLLPKFQGLKEPHQYSDFCKNKLEEWLAGKESPVCRDSIVLVDPGEIDKIKRYCPEGHPDLTYFVFEHDINVPLGVGFSLTALPQLLKGQLWRNMLAAADEAFSSLRSEDMNYLSELGISLDLGVLPRTRAAYLNENTGSRSYSETPQEE